MIKATTIKVVTDASVVRVDGKYKGRAGIMVLDEGNTLKHFESRHIGNVTSNEGEYLSLLEGVRVVTSTLAREKVDPKDIMLEMYTDSSLVYNQLLENFKTKKRGFVQMQKDIKFECKKFKGTKVVWHQRDLDMAMLADFGSKHPRRTKAIFDVYKDKDFSEAVTKAAKFLLKDEATNARNKEKGEEQ